MSASADREDRNLPATPRRLERAREEGQVPRSRELGSFAVIGAAAATLAATGPTLFESARALVGAGLRFDAVAAHRPEAALERFASLAWGGSLAFGGLFAVLLAAAVAAPLAIGGWLWSAKAFTPDFTRLDPMAGLGRMASREAWIELAKAAAKAAVLGLAGAWAAWQALPMLSAAAVAGVGSGIQLAIQALAAGLVLLLAGLAVLAAIDVPLALHQFHSRLKMTRQEVMDEQRESEGDPQLKARVRSTMRANARRRMMAAVPKAAVVVTNPTHYAVAIDWREGMRAPRVVAKGTGLIAERIKEIAKEAGVPRLEAPPLARALNRHVEIDAEVPAALYQAVAQVLAWVFQVRAADARGRPHPATPAAIAVPAGLDPLEKGGEA